MRFHSVHELTQSNASSFSWSYIEIPIYISNYSILLFKLSWFIYNHEMSADPGYTIFVFSNKFLSFNTKQSKVTKETFMFHIKSEFLNRFERTLFISILRTTNSYPLPD